MSNQAVLDREEQEQQAIRERLKKKQKEMRAKRRVDGAAGLAINSLMDMMVIILAFLLKSNGTEPIKVLPGMNPPFSVSEIKPRDTTVITITPNSIVLMEKEVLQLMDGRKVEKAMRKGGESGMIIQPLEMALRDKVEEQKNFARQTGGEFQGDLIILADHETPYLLIAQVMQTAIGTEFKKFQFAAIQDFRLSSSGRGKLE